MACRRVSACKGYNGGISGGMLTLTRWHYIAVMQYDIYISITFLL